MASEVRNAASDRWQSLASRFSDRDWVKTQARATLSDSFVREDRQQIVGLPTADADTWLADFDDWFNIEDGRPSFYLAEIIAVRGQRLALGRIGVAYAGSPAGEGLMVLQFDAQINLTEKMIAFDLTDIDVAVTELDAMHTALTS